MYNRKKKRALYSIKFKDSEPLTDEWYEDTSEKLKKNIEDGNADKIKQYQEPLNQNVSNSAVINNSVIDDPKALNPPLKNKTNKNDSISSENLNNEYTPSENQYTSSNKSKKINFSLQNVFISLFVLVGLYFLYKHFSNSKGKLFFGARECASYDISNAYNMVR